MFDRFTEGARKVVVVAQDEARKMGHQSIGSEHILLALTLEEEGIAYTTLKAFNVSSDDVKDKIDTLKERGSSEFQGHIPFSPRAKKVLELSLREALTLAHSYIGTEHLLLGIIRESNSTASQILISLSVDLDTLKQSVLEELQSRPITDDEQVLSHPSRGNERKSNKALEAFGTNLTKKAKEGELDPVIGRVNEIDRLIQILSRRTKNNPILVGEPGVGKTAIIEGLAQKIAEGSVPNQLKEMELISIDLSSLIAGARYRGDFEERFKKLLNEVDANPNIILFFDEIHTLIGAGGSDGAVDASNMMKPLLSRGKLRTIGATTYDEYRKKFAKDTAMVRRFQTIDVAPPTVEDTIKILSGIKDRYEEFHNAIITDEAVTTAVNLSDRYITDRHLPDKAIDIIDEASARGKIAHQENNSEEQLVIDKEIIAEVVSQWTKVPLKQISASESKKLTNLENDLEQSVIGQSSAVSKLARAVRRSRTGLKDPKRPAGSFIFAGPTGVGKSQLAKSLAENLFGSEQSLIRFDMSEYMEKHAVSRLIGSPPGYVGFDEGGQLTEKVRRNPFSVILFDEIEKAHPDIYNTFLQILDDGVLTDSQGRQVNFKNTFIIMTTNLGAKELAKVNSLGFSNIEGSSLERLERAVKSELKENFKPEFLNRIDEIVIFGQLELPIITRIVDLQINALAQRLESRMISISVSNDAKTHLSNEGFDPSYGVRPLKRVIQTLVEDKISEMILSEELTDGSDLLIDLKNNELVFIASKPIAIDEEFKSLNNNA